MTTADGVLNAVILEKQKESNMGFGNFLMSMAKNMLGDVVGSSQEMQRFKSEYDRHNTLELKKEYSRLKKAAHTTENTNRKMAIANILRERG